MTSEAPPAARRFQPLLLLAPSIPLLVVLALGLAGKQPPVGVSSPWGHALVFEAALAAVLVGLATLLRHRRLAYVAAGAVFLPWLTTVAATMIIARSLPLQFTYSYQKWSLLTGVFGELRMTQVAGPLASALLLLGASIGLLLVVRGNAAASRREARAVALALLALFAAAVAWFAPWWVESTILGVFDTSAGAGVVHTGLTWLQPAQLARWSAPLALLAALALLGWVLLRKLVVAVAGALLGLVALHGLADQRLLRAAQTLLAPPWRGQAGFEPLRSTMVRLQPWAPKPGSIVVLGRRGPTPKLSFISGEAAAIAPDGRRRALPTLQAAVRAGASSLTLVGTWALQPKWQLRGQNVAGRRPLLVTFQTRVWGEPLALVATSLAAEQPAQACPSPSQSGAPRRKTPLRVGDRSFQELWRAVEDVRRRGCEPLLATGAPPPRDGEP